MKDLILNIKFNDYYDLAMFAKLLNHLNKQQSGQLLTPTNGSYTSVAEIYADYMTVKRTWDLSAELQQLYESKGCCFYDFCLTQFG